MENHKTRGLNFGQKIKNAAYNIKYKALSFLEQCPLEQALSPYQTIYLLGKQYCSNPANNKQVNRQIAQHFKNILWITYRSGFPELLHEYGHTGSFVTDTGWGCMIRVGQMLFAQIIKNYLKPKTKYEYSEICNFFNDFKPEALFSIQRIAKVGKYQFNLNPGEWYNPAQIAYILSGFLNEGKEPKLLNIKSHIFNNSSFFYDQVIQKFNPKQIETCLHPVEENIVCSECYSSDRQVAVTMLVRLGLHSPESQYLEVLNLMMTWKWFRGILGGKPQKALYFVGLKQNNYIYLDPHYVQTAKEEITKQQNYDYFCDSLRLCKISSTDPSLGICFYFQSLQELNQFYVRLKQLKSQKSSGFFLFIADRTPEYMGKEKELTLAKDVEESAEFEVI